jgi:steroid delta-isomerase-like uncharacterized protein
MTPEQMRRVHEEHLAAEARGDIDAAVATYHDNCYYHSVGLGVRFEGKAAVKMQYQATFTAFPDAEGTQEDELYGDDVLMDRGTFNATMTGPFLGIAPTGRRLSLPFARVVPFQDGLMEAEILYFDFAALCEQIGISVEEAREAVARLREAVAAAVAPAA